MSQLILVKRDYPDTRLVILGGKEAPYVSISPPLSIYLSDVKAGASY